VNALALALAGLALGAAPKSIPEAKVGLAKSAPTEVTVPPVVKENDSAPGERPVRPRAYPGAPPAVPHGVADFLPITRDQNACADCHAIPLHEAAEEGAKHEKYEKHAPGEQHPHEQGEPTPIPASHYTDTRREPGRRQEKIVGARWFCTACHVPQHDVAPLVKNPFPR
jgi:cytochrome c-type protein NapB